MLKHPLGAPKFRPIKPGFECAMYSFEYFRPESVSEAVSAYQDDSRFLAGGQSLVQAMKLRLSSSNRLVDLRGIKGLSGIQAGTDMIEIGAMTTHADVAASTEVRRLLPALSSLAGGIGDPMVRNRGTIGGSIANADPAACYPSAVLALGASLKTDRRMIAADNFFTGLYQTALEPSELLVSVVFPAPVAAAYVKYKQPASRFALVGVFVACHADRSVRVAVTGGANSVFRCRELETALEHDFSVTSAQSVIIPEQQLNSDLHGTASYRARMISVMAGRAVEQIIGAN